MKFKIISFAFLLVLHCSNGYQFDLYDDTNDKNHLRFGVNTRFGSGLHSAISSYVGGNDDRDNGKRPTNTGMGNDNPLEGNVELDVSRGDGIRGDQGSDISEKNSHSEGGLLDYPRKIHEGIEKHINNVKDFGIRLLGLDKDKSRGLVHQGGINAGVNVDVYAPNIRDRLNLSRREERRALRQKLKDAKYQMKLEHDRDWRASKEAYKEAKRRKRLNRRMRKHYRLPEPVVATTSNPIVEVERTSVNVAPTTSIPIEDVDVTSRIPVEVIDEETERPTTEIPFEVTNEDYDIETTEIPDYDRNVPTSIEEGMGREEAMYESGYPNGDEADEPSDEYDSEERNVRVIPINGRQ